MKAGVDPAFFSIRNSQFAIHRGGPPLAAYLGLLAVGFTLPRSSPTARCALTAPFHPYRGNAERRKRINAETGDVPCSYFYVSTFLRFCVSPAVSFLWHFPSARAGLALPTTVPCPVRTFLPEEGTGG